MGRVGKLDSAINKAKSRGKWSLERMREAVAAVINGMP